MVKKQLQLLSAVLFGLLIFFFLCVCVSVRSFFFCFVLFYFSSTVVLHSVSAGGAYCAKTARGM